MKNPKTYSEEWWKIVEGDRIEKAGNFATQANVVSDMSARLMVVEAINLIRGKYKNNKPSQ